MDIAIDKLEMMHISFDINMNQTKKIVFMIRNQNIRKATV